MLTGCFTPPGTQDPPGVGVTQPPTGIPITPEGDAWIVVGVTLTVPFEGVWNDSRAREALIRAGYDVKSAGSNDLFAVRSDSVARADIHETSFGIRLWFPQESPTFPTRKEADEYSEVLYERHNQTALQTLDLITEHTGTGHGVGEWTSQLTSR